MESMIVQILRTQLETANETIKSLLDKVDSMAATIESLRSTIASLEATLQEKNHAIDAGKRQINALNKLSGSKSEKVKVAVGQSTAAGAAVQEKPKYETKERGNNGARRDMHLEMDTTIKDVYPDTPNLDLQKAIEIGIKETTRYTMIPPRFLKTVYRLHSFRQDEKIYSPVAPASPLLHSSFDGSFVAGIAQLRYIYSMPVERIVKYFAENGFNLKKSTAGRLLNRTADVCQNLYMALKDEVLGDRYLSGDETYHRVLVDNRDGMLEKGVKKAYIWGLEAMTRNLVYFFYREGSRAGNVLLETIGDYAGALQSDGLSVYKKTKALRLACLQHCKRKFLDDAGNPDADRIVSWINELYRKEHEHRIGENGWTEADNLRWRQKYAPPILMMLKADLRQLSSSPEYPPKTIVHDAASYMLNEWDGVEAIFTGGLYNLDNNAIERMNRYYSLSRRNSLFFGSHNGAVTATIYYSLACSCKLNGVNFFEYLSEVLNRTATWQPNTPLEQYKALLPNRWNKL